MTTPHAIDDVPRPPAAYTELLIALRTPDHYHSERSLYDHLLGTWTLLDRWDHPDTLCSAGLFHSIYGVQNRYVRADRFGRRDAIRAVIGEPAERLVYLFCSLPRGSYLGERPGSINADEQRALIEIEVANLLEQTPRVPHFCAETRAQIIDRLAVAQALMSPQARAASHLLARHGSKGTPPPPHNNSHR